MARELQRIWTAPPHLSLIKNISAKIAARAFRVRMCSGASVAGTTGIGYQED